MPVAVVSGAAAVENTLRTYGQEIVCFCIEWDLAFKGAVCGFFENVAEKRANDIIPSPQRDSRVAQKACAKQIWDSNAVRGYAIYENVFCLMRIKVVKCWIHPHECCRCLTTNPDDRLLIGFLFYDDVIAVAIHTRKVMILIVADSRNVSSPWKWRTPYRLESGENIKEVDWPSRYHLEVPTFLD